MPRLFRSLKANSIALVGQIIFGLWLLGLNAYSGWTGWRTYGDGRPKPPLYGIWHVEEFPIDDHLRLLTDPDRFRRPLFDFPDSMAFQRIDDSFAYYNAMISLKDRNIVLSDDGGKNWSARFTFAQLAADQLTPDGNIANRTTHMKLRLLDRAKFPLVEGGFHLVQESPFNR